MLHQRTRNKNGGASSDRQQSGGTDLYLCPQIESSVHPIHLERDIEGYQYISISVYQLTSLSEYQNIRI